MARRDVDLVIRARDEAKGALDAITKTLTKFTGAQKETQAEARETDTQLDRLGSSLAELQKNLKSVTGGGAVAQELEKARSAFKRVEQATRQNEEQLVAYTIQSRAAAKSTERLAAESARLSNAVKTQEKAVDKARSAQKNLDRTAKDAAKSQTSFANAQERVSRQISEQSQKLDQYETKFAELGAEIAKTEKPTANLNRQFERFTGSIEKTRARLADLSETQNLITASSERTNRVFERSRDIYGQQAGSLSKVEKALADLKQQQSAVSGSLQAATRDQTKLSAAAQKAGASLKAQGAALEQAETSYREINAVVQQTEGALSQLEQRTRGPLLKAFGQQAAQLKKTEQSFTDNSREAQRLAKELQQVEAPSRELQQSFESYRAAAARGRTEIKTQQRALADLRGVLRESGGDIDTFSARQNRFATILERSSKSFREYQAAARAAAASNARLVQSQNQAVGSSNRLSGATRTLSATQGRAARNTGLFADAIRRSYGDTRRALSFTQRLRGEVLSLLAAYGGFFAAIEGVRGVVNAFQTLEAAQNRLNVVFNGDQLAINQELDFVRRTAERLGIEFGTLAQEYTKFAIATQGTNLEGEETRRIFTAVAEAGRVNNLTMEQLQGTFVALTQIVSKGSVSMEELRQQLGDRLPGALQIMAAGLKVGTDELIKMIEQGQVSSDALSNFATELDDRFGKALPQSLRTTNAALGKFQNAVFQTFLAVGEGGAIRGFTNLLLELTETLKSAQFQDFASRVGAALESIFGAIGAVVSNFDLLIIAITTFIGLKLAPFIVGLVVVLTRLPAIIRLNQIRMNALRGTLAATSSSFTGAATAVTRLRGALTLLMSSTGIGLLVTLIGTGIGLWVTRTSEATEALQRHQQILDTVRNAYDKTGDSVDDWRKKVEDLTLTQAQANLDTLNIKLDELKRAFADSLPKNIFGNVVGAGGGFFLEVEKLFKQFESGAIGIEEFVLKLDKLNVSFRDLFPVNARFANSFDEAARALREGGRDVNNARDVIIALTGSADQAALALQRLGGAVKDSTSTPSLNLDEVAAKAAEKRANARAFEVEQQRRLLEGQNREAAIEAARKAAQDKKLSAAEIELEVKKAATLFDEKAASEAEKRAKAREFEVDQQRLLLQGQEREAAVEAARKKAQDQRLSDAEIELEVQKAGTIFDEKAADEARKRAESREFEVEQQKRILQGREREATIEAARKSAQDQRLSDAEIELEVRKAATLFDGQAADEAEKRASSREFEVAQQRRLLQGLDREAALEAARKSAQDQRLSAAEIELEVRKAATIFDEQAADAAQKRASSRDFDLEQQRRILQGQEREAAIEAARKSAQDQRLSATETELEVRKAAALFDEKAADDARKRADSREFEVEQQKRILQGLDREASIEAARKSAQDQRLSAAEIELEVRKAATLFDQAAAEASNKRAKGREFEVEQQRRLLQGLDREAAIEAARKSAQDQRLSAVETELEVRKAATIFDEKAADDARRRADARSFEVKQQRRILQGLDREAAIEESRRAAQEQRLSAAETELEVRKAATLFDEKATEDARKRAESRQFEVDQQRRTLDGLDREAAIEAARKSAQDQRLSAAETELEIKKAVSLFDAAEADSRRQREQDLQFQIDQQRLILAGKDREATLETAIYQAKKRNKDISEPELDLLRQKTGELFDLKNSESAVNDLLAYRNQLRQQLAALLDQQNIFELDGEQVTAIQEELQGVNDQLQDAIGNAIQLFEALGSSDPAVQAIISKLKTLSVTSQQTANGAALSFSKVEEVLSSNLVNAANNFAQSLAEGKSVTESLKDAFLQFASDFLRQIAQMILQQITLNAVKAIGRSFGFGVAHSGGVIGQQTIQRKVNPGAFGSIMKYHSGGIAGLQPGEVPTILQRGEEVLTGDDPRHIFNRGKTQGGSGGMKLKIVNALDSSEVVSEGLNTVAGEEAVMNVIRSNGPAIRAITQE